MFLLVDSIWYVCSVQGTHKSIDKLITKQNKTNQSNKITIGWLAHYDEWSVKCVHAVKTFVIALIIFS